LKGALSELFLRSIIGKELYKRKRGFKEKELYE
jgi:hypothetical protein